MNSKAFVFLYPISEIINYEINNNGQTYPGGIISFKKLYTKILNTTIDIRYRNEGFSIFYATFNNHPISSIISLKPEDKIISVGLDYKTHVEQKKYPDQKYILNNLGNVKTLRVAGFHMWDCVEKLAKTAYEHGLDVLVDEDLTEFFSQLIKKGKFNPERFSNADISTMSPFIFEQFIATRKKRPWLFQAYQNQSL